MTNTTVYQCLWAYKTLMPFDIIASNVGIGNGFRIKLTLREDFSILVIANMLIKCLLKKEHFNVLFLE